MSKSKMNELLLNVPTFRFFRFCLNLKKTNSCLANFFIQIITSKNFTPVNSSISKSGKEGHSSIPHCVPKLTHLKLVNSKSFFVTEYRLITVNMCITFKIYYFYRKLCTGHTHFQDFSLSAIWRT